MRRGVPGGHSRRMCLFFSNDEVGLPRQTWNWPLLELRLILRPLSPGGASHRARSAVTPRVHSQCRSLKESEAEIEAGSVERR